VEELAKVFVKPTSFADVQDGCDRMGRVRGRGKVSLGGWGAVRDGVGMVGFEVGDVKGGVDAHSEREVETVGMGGDFGVDGKRTETDMIKFGGRPGGGEMATEEPNELSRFKRGERGTAGVVVTGLSRLGIAEDGGESSMKVVEGSEMRVGSRSLRKAGIGKNGGKGGGVETVGEVEGWVAGGGVNRIVVRELSVGEERGPGGLLKVDEDSEVLFESLVEAFGLSIGLRVKCGGEGRTDVAEEKEAFPKVGGEERVTVWDDLVGEAVKSDDWGEEEVCELRGGDGAGTGKEVG